MAKIMSFDTVCHLEAIARDLTDVLIDTKAIEVLRKSLDERKFEDLVDKVEGEIFCHELANELVEIMLVEFNRYKKG